MKQTGGLAKSAPQWVPVLFVLFAGLAAGESSVDGTWRMRYDTDAGVVETLTTLKADGETLLVVDGDEQTVIGTVRDGAIEFVIPNGLPDVGFSADLVVSARIAGDRIDGYFEYLDYAGEVKGVRGE